MEGLLQAQRICIQIMYVESSPCLKEVIREGMAVVVFQVIYP